MRLRTPSFGLLLLFLGAAPNIRAQEAEVAAAIHATLDAWSAGDFEDFVGNYRADARGFFLDGGPLMQGFSVRVLQAVHDAGFRADVTMDEIDVQLHGDVALSVGALSGSLTLPGGATIEGSWRYSETRILTDGQWKVIQFHVSELTDAFGGGSAGAA